MRCFFVGERPFAVSFSGAVPVMTSGSIIVSSRAGPVDDAGSRAGPVDDSCLWAGPMGDVGADFGAIATKNRWTIAERLRCALKHESQRPKVTAEGKTEMAM